MTDTQNGNEHIKMARLAEIYEFNMNRLADGIIQDFEAQTLQYKKEMSIFVEENIKNGLDAVLNGYVADMEGVRSRMIKQAGEFNAYLQEVNRKNRQLAQRSWIISTACLVILAVSLALPPL